MAHFVQYFLIVLTFEHFALIYNIGRRFADGRIDKKELEDAFISTGSSPLYKNLPDILSCRFDNIAITESIRTCNMNLIYLIEVDVEECIYRHPRPRTDSIINRRSEAFSKRCKKNGTDSTFIYQHPTDG